MEPLEASKRIVLLQFGEIERLFAGFDAERSEALRAGRLPAIRRALEAARGQLLLFKMQIYSQGEGSHERHLKLFADRDMQLKGYAAKLSAGEKELAQDELLLADRAEAGERGTLIAGVERGLAEADGDLDEIIRDLNRGNIFANEITLELRRQQDQLARVKEDMRETYSLARRSKEMIGYFRRTMMTDKLLICLMILLLLAALAIAGLRAAGFKASRPRRLALIPNK